jgi:hypothetical protein
MSTQGPHFTDGTNDLVWLYLLAGYVVGFALAHVLTQRGGLGQRAGALLGGLGAALSGRSPGNPWRS